MVEKDAVSKDFRKQVLGCGLTTAEIVYRRPDRHWLLQSYVWQDYDMFPNFPKGFPRVLGSQARRPAVCGHCCALQTDQACRTTRRRRSLPAALIQLEQLRRGAEEAQDPIRATDTRLRID
jgi:Usg-like family